MTDMIWIQESARRDFLRYRSDTFPLENGGILLGYSTEESGVRHWVISSATGPGKRAKHGRYRFTPDDDHHTNEAKRHYYQTGGYEYYLGDWHTHPNATCLPSILDRVTLYRNARRADHLGFRSLMLIIGGEIDSAYYGAYVRAWSPNVFKIFGESRTLTPRFFE